MKKEFIPYEEALVLKELGFDYCCFCSYPEKDKLSDSFGTFYRITPSKVVLAPLYQQVFRWFRDIHNMPHSIIVGTNPTTNIAYANNIPAVIEGKTDSVYTTYEEAELACLRKLIEIVKQEQDEKRM